MGLDWRFRRKLRIWKFLAGGCCFTVRAAEELYRKAAELRPGRFATVYTGEIPDDTEYALSFSPELSKMIVARRSE